LSLRSYWSDAWLLTPAFVLDRNPVTVEEVREAGD